MGCLTLCDNKCVHCTRPHVWGRCHMYGLGVYLADQAFKSHLYVRPTRGFVKPTEGVASHSVDVYSLIRCRVCIGAPYVIKGNKATPDAMHDFCECQDPTEKLEVGAQPWFVKAG